MTVQTSNTVRSRGTLRRRMTVGFGLAAFLILLALAFFFWQLTALRGATQDLKEQNDRLVLALETAQQATSLVVVIQDRTDEHIPAVFIEDVSVLAWALETRRDELGSQLDRFPEGDPMRSYIEKTTESLQNMINVVEGTVRHVEDGNWPAAELRAALLLERHDDVEWQVQQLVSLARDRHARAEARANEAMAKMVSVSVTLVVVALVIGAAVIFVTVRSITLGVERLSQSARQLAEGRFDGRISVSGQGELDQVAQSFNVMATQLQATIDTLEDRVAERTAALARRSVQLEAAAQIAREAAAILDVGRLMDVTVRLISERFEFYHAGIFLLDEREEYAVLQAASSEGGQQMLARGHKLKIGETGIVGYTAGTGKPRIAFDVGADAVSFDNPDLPNTRSELGLPLGVGERVIGVLDVQSAEEAAFSDEDMEVLQIMADQVALAIENARLLEESQRALRELGALYGQQVREAWRERTARQPTAYRYTGVGVEPVPRSSAPEMEAPQSRRWPVVVQEEGGRRLVATIRLRGQVLGSIILRQDSEGEPWSGEEIALVEELVTQIGLALENARLLEETRQRAEREQLIAEITSRVRSSMDPETILRTAVRELGAALGTDRAFVKLGGKTDGGPIDNGHEPMGKKPSEG
jgi:GAF domain-containing protein/HAMP domain-containing protein